MWLLKNKKLKIDGRALNLACGSLFNFFFLPQAAFKNVKNYWLRFKSQDTSHKEAGLWPLFKNPKIWSSCRGAAGTNLTRNHEVSGLIPGLPQWVKAPLLP